VSGADTPWSADDSSNPVDSYNSGAEAGGDSGGDGGGGVSLPSWLGNLKTLATVGPKKFILRRIVEFVLGGIGAIVFGVANRIDQLWGIIQDGLVAGVAPIDSAISGIMPAITGVGLTLNQLLYNVASYAGPFAPVVVLGLWTVIMYLLFRALIAVVVFGLELFQVEGVVTSFWDGLRRIWS
jgi:hypothetical protein